MSTSALQGGEADGVQGLQHVHHGGLPGADDPAQDRRLLHEQVLRGGRRDGRLLQAAEGQEERDRHDRQGVRRRPHGQGDSDFEWGEGCVGKIMWEKICGNVFFMGPSPP